MPFQNDYSSVQKEILTLSLSTYETKEHPQKRNTSCYSWTIIPRDHFITDKLNEKKNDKKFVISIYQRLCFLSLNGSCKFVLAVLCYITLNLILQRKETSVIHKYFVASHISIHILQHFNV